MSNHAASIKDRGAFWRSQLLSRLDAALFNSGIASSSKSREPDSLRATALYCREVASTSEASTATHLIAVAEELESEALGAEEIATSKREPGPAFEDAHRK